MRQTFGEQLQRFAKSVDIVDAGTLEAIKRIVLKYVKDELQIEYFELMVETKIDNREDALRALWRSPTGGPDTSTLYSVREGGKKTYTNHAAKCFIERCEYWIVAESGMLLKASPHLIDLWHGTVDLPPYQDVAQRDIRTSILLPLYSGNRCCGVVLFETDEYVEPTSVAKAELSRAVASLGDLYFLNHAHSAQQQNTASAIDDLRALQKAHSFQQLKKPSVFVAFSARADKAVVDAINSVLARIRKSPHERTLGQTHEYWEHNNGLTPKN